ncbi:MAG: GNAT family N-acetyltransferase [Variovorax sp.]
MQSATQIRLAVSADEDAVLSLGRALHAESRFRNTALNVARTRVAIRALIEGAPAGCVLLAEHRHAGVIGMLAGYVSEYFFADVRVAQDKCFYVLPQYRGSAAALKLLIAFRRWAENRDARELCVNMSVDIDQERFGRFMRHMKFSACGSNFVLALTPAHAVG